MPDEVKQRLTCFISHNANVNIDAVRAVLEDLGVSTYSINDVELGSSISASVRSAVSAADFLCLIIDESGVSPAMMFEAGFAAGSLRPTIVLTSNATYDATPLTLLDAPVIRFDPDDINLSALRMGIRAYTSNVHPIASELKIDWPSSAAKVKASTQYLTTLQAQTLERRVAEALHTSGALVATNVVLNSKNEIDILASFPSLGDAFNPIVIEVKHSSRRLPDEHLWNRLQSQMKLTKARIGVLVVGDSEIDYDERVTPRSAMIWISASSLENWAPEQLMQTLNRVRNKLVHLG